MLRKKDDEKILDMNATMQGNLVFSDPVNLRISGRFEGNLNVKGNLIIGESAVVEAEIVGENITIAGKVKGKIKATNSLTLTSTADVVADIETSTLVIEAGAIFNGKCLMLHQLISIQELSEYLSIEEQKILEWVNSGQLPARKEGQVLLFDRRQVEAWISKNY